MMGGEKETVWLCSSVEYTELVSDKTASQFKWRMTTTSRNTSTLLQCVSLMFAGVLLQTFTYMAKLRELQ